MKIETFDEMKINWKKEEDERKNRDGEKKKNLEMYLCPQE